jgi:Holliday junction resolvasome RuvABC endonuclease subunit
VSAASTGWAFSVKDNLKSYGTIETNPKDGRAKRLQDFKNELRSLLAKYKPSFVVIENGYAGRNVKTLKVLCEFAGVAKMCCMDMLDVEPFVMNVNTPRAHFKAKNKQEVFEIIVDLYDLDGFEFKTHNDITDACAQSVCFYEQEIKKVGKK